ncbi:hypothetical protein [Aquisphaera giovannonii]|uniref:hypothetical protein n=1 Tax=Aquisphaera giovannonii TaxID=406548 RepID=UPI0011DFD1C7|nr:hypothetical protein [Aquisphaera giovannonii]
MLLGHQASTCLEFMKNFCPPHATIPPAASPVVRQMSAQPGVYWWLKAPFLDLVGLYSNCGEGPGVLRGKVPGDHRYDWFKGKVLPEIAAGRNRGPRKALVVAIHRPAITERLFDPRDEGHAPSDQMGADLGEAFRAAGAWPDALLAGHVHNYQRFTRTVGSGPDSRAIPYIIAGGGGRVPQADGRGLVAIESLHVGSRGCGREGKHPSGPPTRRPLDPSRALGYRPSWEAGIGELWRMFR